MITLFEEVTYERDSLLKLIGDQIRSSLDDETRAQILESLVSVRLSPGRLEWLGAEDELGDHDGEDSAQGGSINLLRAVPGGFKVADIVGAGALEPQGLQFEILPKLRFGGTPTPDQDTRDARDALRRMWEVAEGGTRVEETRAAVDESSAAQLHEWLIDRFLADLEALLVRGIRMQYTEREDNLSVLRGRLLPRENLRLNTFAPHRFYCRFDELSTDRPENRLIRSALERIARVTADASNKRRARSLLERLHEVPPSRRFRTDFALWRDDRLMQHYRHIRSTCRWVLYEETPTPVSGKQAMFGCFTRMSKLFERYVERWIESKLCQVQGLTIKAQDRRRLYYADSAGAALPDISGGSRMLSPDLVIFRERDGEPQAVGVFDAKWKPTHPAKGISREDAFQMVTYARFWLHREESGADQEKALALIYPESSSGSHVGSRSFRFEMPMTSVSLSMLWFKLPRRNPDAGSQGWSEGIDWVHLSRILGLAGLGNRSIESESRT